jgi:acetamidase/formamidase
MRAKKTIAATTGGICLALALTGGAWAQTPAPGAPPTPAGPGGGAARDASQGQTAQPPGATMPVPPNLQDPTTFQPFVYGPLKGEGMVAAGAAGKKPTTHLLPATPATTQWGWFDNAQAPVLRINSGDTIVMETMMHSHNQVVPGITIEQVKKTRTDYPGRGPHTLTGPVFVEEAEPGDVLRIRLNKIVPRAYATNFNVPGMFGQFPKEFPDGQIKFFYLDLDKKQMEFAPGIVIPLKPFPGTLGVARAEPGRYSSVPPGRYAGNLDIREMGEGATLYVPVFVKGALLWSGDSHAGQGNGEVNLTAIETAYKELNMTVDVIKGQKLEWPRIETPTDWITVGLDQDLNKALDHMKAETTKFLVEERKVAKEQAEATMLDLWNCPISQVVNVVKGTYCMLPKQAGAAKPTALPREDNAEVFATYAKDPDLNKAMDGASMAMINGLVQKKGLTRLDSYALASMAMDCRIAPHKDGDKEVHCMVPKSLWQ